jgi:RNA polymerase sigma-70 factor (ECF subfamily)
VPDPELVDMHAGDERDLIARVRQGDRLAARTLYDAHAPRVHRVVYRIVGDRDLAEECTQDTFVKAFTQLDRFRGDSSLGTWLHAIAVSMALNGLRRVKRLRARETDLDAAATRATGPGPGEPDLRERLRAAIDALPDKLRLPVILHDLEGFTHSEISRMTGVPEGTCKTRLAGGRARLREALAAFARS